MTTSYRPKMIEPAFLSFMSSRLQPFWSARTPKLRLINRHALSDDLVALQFDTNAMFNKHVFGDNSGWRGGQHLSVRIAIDYRYYERHYSLIGLPNEALWWEGDRRAPTLSLAVKPQGVVSNYLAHAAPLGTIIESSLPSGDFSITPLDDERSLSHEAAPLLCIAGGSGITPMPGLIREALVEGRSVTLLHYQRGRILQDYWQNLAKTYPNFCYRLIDTQDASTYLAGERHVSAAALRSLGLNLSATTIMACGSVELIAGLYRAADEISSAMMQRVTLRDNIIVEHFGLAPLAAADGLDIAVQTVQLRQRGRTFTSDGVLLVAAENAGVKLPFGCRQGICHLCRCNKVSGVVKNIQTGTLSGAGYEPIQTCISVAMSDVVLDI